STDLHVVELTHDVEQVAAGDRRHLAKTPEIRTMANRAGRGFAVGTGLDQIFALLDRARRDVVIEAMARIARFGSVLILRHRDDALADRLHAGIRTLADEAHGAGADIGLRNLGRLDHFDVTLVRLDLPEVPGRVMHFLFSHALGDSDHDSGPSAITFAGP